MRKSTPLWFACFHCLWLAMSVAADTPELRAIQIESRSGADEIVLGGSESRWQLVVTGHAEDNRAVDVTRRAVFQSHPSDIVRIRSDGWVTPLRDGRTVISVCVDQLEARIAVRVQHVDNPQPLDFVTDVAPLFTRYGCNSGGCHGKKGGQDGFELALLGFEPELDYDRLVNEDDGYRLDLEDPENSLVLLYATETEPHTGGKRFAHDTLPYRLLKRWIEQGAPRHLENAAVVERIEVLPGKRFLELGDRQQLLVLAHFSDRSIRDVTHLSQFESNQPDILSVTEDGLVAAGEQFGVAAIMTRYQAHVGVFHALVPSGNSVEIPPPTQNFVDQLVNNQLHRLGIPLSGPCDDGTFIRRVTIDIAGRLPTIEETNHFVADPDSSKYERLIDRLLDSREYADYFAGKWAALLHNRRNSPDDPSASTDAFYAWVHTALRENWPFDQVVHGVLTATGTEVECPPIIWYRSAREASQQVEDVAQLLLGQRIQCARCHHHPFEKWSEQDYYGLAAFFSRLTVDQPKPDKKQKSLPPVNVSFEPGVAEIEHPKTGRALQPTPLGGAPLDLDPQDDPREALVTWMTQAENEYFARTLANRYWKHFLGRGLVEPEDDLRATNPATHPELLDALAGYCAESGFDLRQLIRLICLSQAYRRSATANGINLDDHQNYSRFLPRRLNAEVFLDAIDTVTATQTQFAGHDADLRAIQLPDNQSGSYFLNVFGRPEGLTVCECERSSSGTVAQQLFLLNSPEILEKVGGPRAQSLANDPRPHAERIREIYLLALSRSPTPLELEPLLDHIAHSGDPTQKAYADILWAVLNTREFQFNH